MKGVDLEVYLHMDGANADTQSYYLICIQSTFLTALITICTSQVRKRWKAKDVVALDDTVTVV